MSHHGIYFHSFLSNAPTEKSVIFVEMVSLFIDDDDEDDEEFINFVVIDEFHEKFGPAVS